MEVKKRTRRGGGDRASQAPKMRKSCDSCALAKRKCDGKSSCSLCRKRASPCVYSERQKSGPKGVKADEDADVCADTTTVANNTTTAPIATTTNTAAAATTADPDPALRKSPAKRVLVPSPSSKALGPRQKKQATTQHKPPTTAAVGWLTAVSASLAKGQLPPTNKAGSGGGAASVGVSVNTNATVSVSAATLPPATPKPSPTSYITPPPRVKPKTPAGKEPRPAHQRQKNRPKQQHRQRASSSSTSASPPKLLSAASPPTDRARAGAGAGGVVSPTPTPSPPRRRTTPQFNSTAAAKIAALPPLMPCGENINISAASAAAAAAAAASRSPYPSLIRLDSGSLGLCGIGVGGVGGLPSMPPAPPLSDSASSGEGSSRWGSVSEMFVASPEDEMVWSGDEFSGDGGGGGGGSRDDEEHHLGGGGRGGFFYDLPLAIAMSGGRSGVAACRDIGKGQLPVPQPRPCSPIMVMVSPGRHAGGGWGGGGGPDLKPTAFGGGRAHDGSHAVRSVEGSPINSWTPEFAEAALNRVFSEAECVLPPSGVGGGSGIGGAGAGMVAGAAAGGGGLHPADKRQFLSWSPLSQQQQQQQQSHHAYVNQDGFAGASFANTGGFLPPLVSPSSSVEQRFWNHGTGQQRGDARNFPDVTTVTTPLVATPWN